MITTMNLPDVRTLAAQTVARLLTMIRTQFTQVGQRLGSATLLCT